MSDEAAERERQRRAEWEREAEQALATARRTATREAEEAVAAARAECRREHEQALQALQAQQSGAAARRARLEDAETALKIVPETARAATGTQRSQRELEVRQQVELEVRQQVELEVRQEVERERARELDEAATAAAATARREAEEEVTRRLEIRHNQAVELQVAELQGQLKAARERQAVLQERVVKLETDTRRSSRGSPQVRSPLLVLDGP